MRACLTTIWAVNDHRAPSCGKGFASGAFQTFFPLGVELAKFLLPECRRSIAHSGLAPSQSSIACACVKVCIGTRAQSRSELLECATPYWHNQLQWARLIAVTAQAISNHELPLLQSAWRAVSRGQRRGTRQRFAVSSGQQSVAGGACRHAACMHACMPLLRMVGTSSATASQS
jgi:hypothetical protein